MKGLVALPSVDDLQDAYQRFQSFPASITLQQLSLWTQWARFDPRLAEQWILHLSKYWKQGSPVAWNEAMRSQPWPAAVGPLFEQIYSLMVLEKAEKRLFQKWFQCAMGQIGPALGEQYFIGLRAFGGELMQKDVTQTLTSYDRWGYYGREILVNKASVLCLSSTLVSPAIRKKILNRLIQEQKVIRCQDYINALEGAVSRRQAELDLQRHPRLRSLGNTRARIYRKGNKA